MENGNGTAPNAKRLLIGGFMAILAAGIGAGVRGGIYGDWVKAFNFTGLETGLIGGAGFTGFCFGIIIGGAEVQHGVVFHERDSVARTENQERAKGEALDRTVAGDQG